MDQLTKERSRWVENRAANAPTHTQPSISVPAFIAYHHLRRVFRHWMVQFATFLTVTGCANPTHRALQRMTDCVDVDVYHYAAASQKNQPYRLHLQLVLLSLRKTAWRIDVNQVHISLTEVVPQA